MIKIITKKEYNRLKGFEDKYHYLVGSTITLCNGKRKKVKTLLNLEKEELVYMILDLNNIACQLKRKIEK